MEKHPRYDELRVKAEEIAHRHGYTEYVYPQYEDDDTNEDVVWLNKLLYVIDLKQEVEEHKSLRA